MKGFHWIERKHGRPKMKCHLWFLMREIQEFSLTDFQQLKVFLFASKFSFWLRGFSVESVSFFRWKNSYFIYQLKSQERLVYSMESTENTWILPECMVVNDYAGIETLNHHIKSIIHPGKVQNFERYTYGWDRFVWKLIKSKVFIRHRNTKSKEFSFM